MAKSKVAHLWQRYQIKVNLQGAKPPIWRRLIVDSRTPLDALHVAIQVSMGWSNSHLHQFIDNDNNVYSEADEELDFAEVNEEKDFMLSNLLNQEKQFIHYDYDFGDDWSHKITLEKILPADNQCEPIQCVKGMRICPMEDSGGFWGYQRFLDILKDPDDEEYEDTKEWFGEGFDPDAKFDLKGVQARLKNTFKDVRFTAKKSRKKPVAKQSNELDIFNEMFGLDDSLLADFEDATDVSEDYTALINDPETPDEIKMLLTQMMTAMEVIEVIGDLLEDSYQAFDEIAKTAKDKKIVKIARNMVKQIDEKG